MRYVTDVPYIAGFTAEISPEWLDLVALISGFAPPRRDRGFAWCELGCGPGMAPIIFASSHPEGEFHGIDAMSDHIERGRLIAERAGVTNLHFHALDFARALDLDLPKFQYIVAHGVYAWVDDEARAALRRFVKRHLAPGGLVYVSYNSMPGWASDLPFQHLVYALAEHEAGDSIARFTAAAAVTEKMKTVGAGALLASPTAVAMEDLKTKRPLAYFAHEYLAPAWRPLYVDEMRREMVDADLSPVGSATLRDNFDSFVLRRAARDALEEVADPDMRELMRDYFMSQRFRRDVYARSPDRLDDDERRRRLFERSFALMRPASMVEYAMTTEAGSVGFDNPVARRIVDILAEGTRTIGECLENGVSEQDLLANALALACAGIIGAATPDSVDVSRLNAVLLEMLDARTETTFHVMPCGTALRFDGAILLALRDGKPIPESVQPWIDFLRKLS